MENEIAFSSMLGQVAILTTTNTPTGTMYAVDDPEFIRTAQTVYGNDVEIITVGQVAKEGVAHTQLFLNDTGCVYDIR